MVNVVATQDMKEISAILVLPRSMNRIETKRNCSALLVTYLAKDTALRLALKVCLFKVL
jgi:hypothetical protein